MPLRRKDRRQFNLYKYLHYTKKYYFAPDKQSKKVLKSGFTEGQNGEDCIKHGPPWGGFCTQ
jgi:hypothetical protein